MTQQQEKLTEIPLGTDEEVAVIQQPAANGPANKKRHTITGRTVLDIVIAVVVVVAVAIGVASAAGVSFNNDNNGENGAAAENNNALVNNNVDDATAAPVAVPTASPIVQAPVATPAPVDGALDCSFQDEFAVNDDGSLLMRGVINPQENTVTVELEFAGEAWLGFAFSEQPIMVPNTAIIGLPDENKVEKYFLQSRSLAGVNPLTEQQQTLTETSINQDNGITTLRFTKPLVENAEVAVAVGDVRFNWAIGFSNDLNIHAQRGSVVAPFAACLVVEEEEEPPVQTEPPTASPGITQSPTVAPTDAPTNVPTSSPTTSPTMDTVVTLAPATASPTAAPPAGVYSKVGNRKSCAIDACPSAPWLGGTELANGCSCEDGLDTCYWDGPPTTIEYFTDVTLLNTGTRGLWKLEAEGNQLSLGEGGDFASGSDCFDDTLRGGFRVDLTGTGLVFSQQSTVTVSGFSPVMQLTADDWVADEVRQWGAEARLPISIPHGTTVVEVVCGGWPAYCSSDLYVVAA